LNLEGKGKKGARPAERGDQARYLYKNDKRDASTKVPARNGKKGERSCALKGKVIRK